jgi:type I restriction enzyme S subunit
MTDGPYKLPEGWRWVRLGDICLVIETGFAFRKKGAPNGDLLHLRPYNIGEDGTLDLSQRFLVPSDLCPAGRRMLQPGDVLFNNTNSMELVGKTALVTQPLEAAFSNHITLLRTRPEQAEGAWVALALRAMWYRGFFAERCNKWIGQAGINTATLRTFVIPLPPLDEQRRIVAKIQALMARIREAQALRREAQKDTELLMDAALAEFFPRPGSPLPPDWRWVRLGEVVKASFSGGTPSTKVDAYWDGDIPWTTSAPIAEEDVFLERYLRTITREGLENSASRIAPSGSLIVATRVGVGKAVVATFDVAISQDLTALILCEDVNPVFLAHLFKSGTVQAQLLTRTRGTTIKGIPRKELLTALIPLPPLDEQRRIVAYLDQVQRQVTALKQTQAEAEAEFTRLEQAILDKAFRGEL